MRRPDFPRWRWANLFLYRGLAMRATFLNSADDCQWLREGALRGVPLPAKYAGFQSFVLQGNEDAPHAVNLYVSADPFLSQGVHFG